VILQNAEPRTDSQFCFRWILRSFGFPCDVAMRFCWNRTNGGNGG
jgi:hypothetical protein